MNDGMLGSLERIRARVMFCCLFAAVLMLTPTSGNAASLVIDGFSQPADPAQIVEIASGGTPITDPTVDTDGRAVTGVSGGNRWIQVSVQAMGSNLTARAVIPVVEGSTNRYSLSIPDGTVGAGAIVWSGTTAENGCALGLDLSPYDEFNISVLNNDEPAQVQLVVWNSDCTASATQTINIPDSSPGVYTFSFGLFSNPSILTGTAGRIRLNVPNVTALDMSLDYLQADCDTPAPVINSFSANPSIMTPPGTTNLSWNITSTYFVSGRIVSTCVDPSTSTPIASNTGVDVPFDVDSAPCQFTLIAVGECDNDTEVIRINQQPSKVPSLNEWGMIILSLVLAASAAWLLRRRRTS